MMLDIAVWPSTSVKAEYKYDKKIIEVIKSQTHFVNPWDA